MAIDDTTAVKHATAMLLLLTMQDANGNYPNIDYVKSQPSLAAAPAGDPNFLQDLLPHVNPVVYQATNQMMNSNFANNPPVNYAAFQNVAGTSNAFLLRLSQLGALSLWAGPYPHPGPPTMRAVVTQLLA